MYQTKPHFVPIPLKRLKYVEKPSRIYPRDHFEFSTFFGSLILISYSLTMDSRLLQIFSLISNIPDQNKMILLVTAYF